MRRAHEFARALALVLLWAQARPDCMDWCTADTCSVVNSCASCAECAQSQRSGGHCELWCNPWTCGQALECGGCSRCAPAPPPAPLDGVNPFRDVDFVRTPRYSVGVQSSVDAHGGLSSALGRKLAKAATIPTATWIDKVGALPNMRVALEAARAQQRRTRVPTLVVLVVYNLPGRDCSAQSSAGELAAGDIEAYGHTFIDPIARMAEEFAEVPKVFVLEPDSLPNLVTNGNRPRCQAAGDGYKDGIALGIRRLTPLGAVYVDVGWSGWIGTYGAAKMARLLDEILTRAGKAGSLVRGFVTNVSNYGATSNEVAYALALRKELAKVGRSNLAFIVDTGRNGQGERGGWCNAAGAGIGQPPTAEPPGLAYCDAVYWIKPPGESDGTSDHSAKRFDAECAKPTAIQGAPEAGEWFDEQFVQLVQLSSPPLDSAPRYGRAQTPGPPPSPPSPPPRVPLPRPPPSPPPPPPPITDEELFLRQNWGDSPPPPPPRRAEPAPWHGDDHVARPPHDDGPAVDERYFADQSIMSWVEAVDALPHTPTGQGVRVAVGGQGASTASAARHSRHAHRPPPAPPSGAAHKQPSRVSLVAAGVIAFIAVWSYCKPKDQDGLDGGNVARRAPPRAGEAASDSDDYDDSGGWPGAEEPSGGAGQSGALEMATPTRSPAVAVYRVAV